MRYIIHELLTSPNLHNLRALVVIFVSVLLYQYFGGPAEKLFSWFEVLKYSIGLWVYYVVVRVVSDLKRGDDNVNSKASRVSFK